MRDRARNEESKAALDYWVFLSRRGSNEKKNLLDDVYFSKDFQLSEEFEKAKKYLSNLDLTVNSLGLVAGCLIVFWGITGALSSTFAMNPLAMIADIFLSIFGFTMCVLEMKEKSFSKKFLKWAIPSQYNIYCPKAVEGCVHKG